MNIESAIELFRLTVTQSLILVGPLLAAAMAIGLVVSLVQAVTSIHEQTLAFVPKLLGVAFVALISAHWLIRSMMEFTVNMVGRFPDVTR
jgi:flagellar biosynthesis protein FliQ